MNKYDVKDFLKDKLKGHSSTLKETSYDTANEQYLCNDTRTVDVYDFDSYVESNFDKNKLPASPDAVLLGNKVVYFIEFKNQLPENINNINIKNKFEKGTEILKHLLRDFSPRDVKYIFCVVHQAKISRYFNPEHIQSNVTKFGLEEKNSELGGFYSRIITENINFYKLNFKKLEC